MAFDKIIDSAVLNADLTTIANAIREKCGTSGSLSFPDGFVSAVTSIVTAAGGSGGNDSGSGSTDSGLKIASGEFIVSDNYDYTASVNSSSGYTGNILINTGLDDIDILLLYSDEFLNRTADRPCFGGFLYINSFFKSTDNTSFQYPSCYNFCVGYNATTSSWRSYSYYMGPILNNMTTTVPLGSFGIKTHSSTYPIKAGHTLKWIAVQGFNVLEEAL